MKVYLLEFFTGAHNVSVHSTLEKAKEAFDTYVIEHHSCTTCEDECWLLMPSGRWRFADDIDGVADVWVTEFEMDAVIEPV